MARINQPRIIFLIISGVPSPLIPSSLPAVAVIIYIIMLYLSIALYLVTALLCMRRLFTTPSLGRFVIAFFLTLTAGNILVVEILHFLRALNNPLLYLFVQLLVCTALALLLLDPAGRIFKEPLPRLGFAFQLKFTLESFLSLLIFAVLGLAFYVGTLAPINNSDSLNTHLPRIYYWLQHASLESWYNPVTTKQVFYPINLSIQGLWLFLLSGSEMTFFLIPWLGLAAAVASIYEISLLLGAQRKAALTAALISLSFPVVLLQSYSYQGDVFTAALVLISILFLLLFHKHGNQSDLYLSILAGVIAVGTKQTAFLYVPVYAIALLLIFIKRFPFRLLLKAAAVALLFFGAFSSFKFIQNFTETRVEEPNMIHSGFWYYLSTLASRPAEEYITNGLRYAYQAVSYDGLQGNLKLNLLAARDGSFKRAAERLAVDLESTRFMRLEEGDVFAYGMRLPVNEDASWFGPLSFTLLPLAAVLSLFGRGRKTRRFYVLFSVLLMLVFIVGQVMLKGEGWGPNRGRHMSIAFLALAPLLAALVPSKKFIGGVIALLLGLASVYLAVSVLLINDARPLVTTSSLYNFLARRVDPVEVSNIVEAQYVSRAQKAIKSLLLTSPDRANILSVDHAERLYYQNTAEAPHLRFVNANLLPDEPLFIYIEDLSVLEYGLFGLNRTRDLHPVASPEDVPSGATLLAAKARLTELPPGFKVIREDEAYWLLVRD